MNVTEEYDLVIVGAGSGGLSAAAFAAQLGARVALVEKNRVGGDCTWSGCVPSKTLLKTAKVAHEMRTARRYGLPAAEPEIDLKAVMVHVRDVVGEIAKEESPEALRANGIDVFLGEARFLDAHTLMVRPEPAMTRSPQTADDTTLTARNVLIATGAHPFIPPIRGLDEVDYLTYETLWDLETLPRHLLVVGGGPIGCEMAQAFRRLGAEVTLLASRDRLLPRDDPAASRVLDEVFEDEGIRVLFQARAELVWQDGTGIHVGAGAAGLMGDALLLATGRRPNVDGLDLKKAGVAYSSKGIQVDDTLRTSQRHIYAAGDCTGDLQFTHYAGWQATLAARNALLPGASKAVTDQVPWTTFTDPEVAHIGLTETQARDLFGDAIMTCDWPMSRVDRARTDGDTAGFIKLVHKKEGTLLGATIVAGRAGEMIHEWIVALHEGIKVGDLSNAIHVYPSYSVAGQQAAAAIRIDRLLNGISGRVVRGIAHLMR
jgi:pyruvate/2-oxoglutarate dehydrogenase complex dihydrolipoamide dehydrogenase (E3) component